MNPAAQQSETGIVSPWFQLVHEACFCFLTDALIPQTACFDILFILHFMASVSL